MRSPTFFFFLGYQVGKSKESGGKNKQTKQSCLRVKPVQQEQEHHMLATLHFGIQSDPSPTITTTIPKIKENCHQAICPHNKRVNKKAITLAISVSWSLDPLSV